VSSDLPHYAFVHEVDVRFRDLDAMSHVHHGVALIYFEEARAGFWRQVKGSADLSAIDYVIGEMHVRYHGRIHYPARLRVGLSVTRVGNASFDLSYEIRDEQKELLVSGSSSQVMFDYAAGRSKRIPDVVRAALSGES